MLVLTRKSGEAIRIGENITVQILEIKGNQARVGIDAPREQAVHREEIAQKISREKTHSQAYNAQ